MCGADDYYDGTPLQIVSYYDGTPLQIVSYYDGTPLQIVSYYMPSMTLSNNCTSSSSKTGGDKFAGAATTKRKEKYQWNQKSVKK